MEPVRIDSTQFNTVYVPYLGTLYFMDFSTTENGKELALARGVSVPHCS
jgi:hypothetical protein